MSNTDPPKTEGEPMPTSGNQENQIKTIYLFLRIRVFFIYVDHYLYGIKFLIKTLATLHGTKTKKN
jgi:hypothetical protein